MLEYFGGQINTSIIFPIQLRSAYNKVCTVYTDECNRQYFNFNGYKFDINVWDGNSIILNMSSYGSTPYITLANSAVANNLIIGVPVNIINAVFKKEKDYYIEGIATDSLDQPDFWWKGTAPVRNKL